MKIRSLLLASLLVVSTGVALADNPSWDPSRCENNNQVVVTVHNNTTEPIKLSGTCTCKNGYCGISIYGQSIVIPPPGPFPNVVSYQTCGYHAGNDSYQSFSISTNDAGVSIATGLLKFNNDANGMIYNLIFDPSQYDVKPISSAPPNFSASVDFYVMPHNQ